MHTELRFKGPARIERASHALSGFSLIEFIGIVAILAILGAAIAPAVVRRVDQAALTKEIQDVTAISNALTLQIIRTKIMPDETTWAQAAATWMIRPVSQIATNNRNYARAFLIDTNGWLGNFAPGSPFTQTTNGTTFLPVNSRVMIVSTIAGSLPVASGRPGNTAFNDIWSTASSAKPSGWTTWNGNGRDLVIQRMTFDPLFHQLILINHDTNGAAKFSIDTTNAVDIPSGGFGWNASYLDGTAVGLCDSAGVPLTRLVLTRNIGFVFENGSWQGQIINGQNGTNTATSFASTAGQFFKATINPNASKGGNQTTDQSAVVGSMANFMLAFTMWANDSPKHFYYFGVTPSQVSSKLDIWTFIDTEGIGSNPQNRGNLQYFSGTSKGLLQ